MRRGDLAAAWEICDAVLRARGDASCAHLPRHMQWVWRGQRLAGNRVLVRCQHGLGDTIQFVRLLPALRRAAAEVVLWAQPALLPLLRSAEGADVPLPLTDGAPDVAYDVDLEVMELAHALRITLDTLPRDVPYLDAPRSRTLRREPDRLAVGVVWAAGDWEPGRSMHAELLAPLARVPGVELHALQRGPALAEWDPAWGPVSGTDDVRAAGGIMRALDLVITVDSMPAHLAGALGVPVWTLLPARADWRWMDDRTDTPWYPTMRLLRQRRTGDWRPVIARAAGEVARMARGQRARSVA
jgi:hypothetical protein